jgi:predicted nucleotidyltransferase component of viral defense system
MFERFLERLEKSIYRDNFVIKGGVLISSIVGLGARATMDVDTTAVDVPFNMRSIRKAISSICAEYVDDDVAFHVLRLERIKLNVEGYGGIRFKLDAQFQGLYVPFAIDVTVGDAVTAINYSYPCQFSNGRRLGLKAYSVETVLAEKCEAILQRNVVGTRPRDYYDVYVLTRSLKPTKKRFRAALLATCERRGTLSTLSAAADILDAILSSKIQSDYWLRFQREFPYAREISFEKVVESVRTLLMSKP